MYDQNHLFGLGQNWKLAVTFVRYQNFPKPDKINGWMHLCEAGQFQYYSLDRQSACKKLNKNKPSTDIQFSFIQNKDRRKVVKDANISRILFTFHNSICIK